MHTAHLPLVPRERWCACRHYSAPHAIVQLAIVKRKRRDQHHPFAPHLVVLLEEGLAVVHFMGGNSLETLANITLCPTPRYSLEKV